MKYSYGLGLFFIFLVSIIWAASSILVQYLYQELNFNSPFLLTYIGTSLFVILIPIRLLWERRQRFCKLFHRRILLRAPEETAIIIPWSNGRIGTYFQPPTSQNYHSQQDYVRNFILNFSDRGTSSRVDEPSSSSAKIETCAKIERNTEIFDDIDQWNKNGIKKVSNGNRNRNQSSISTDESLCRPYSGVEDSETRGLSLSSPPVLPNDDRITNRSTSIQETPIQSISIDPGTESTSLSLFSDRSVPYSNLSMPSPNQYILSHLDHIRMACKIAPLWFTSNYFYNLSLGYTTITSSTVISSTGSVFTFFFSTCCGDERYTKWKILGVAMAVGGGIFTSLQDATAGDSEDNADVYKSQLWGDAAGLISAIGYGGYTVLVRVLLPKDENRMSMQLFLGYVGLFNMLMLSPILIWTVVDTELSAVEADGQETQLEDQDVAQHLTLFVIMCLVLKGLFDNVISDYLWARSIILTNATVATVGLGLTIPLALLSDIFIMGRRDVLNGTSVIGALLVLVGFTFVNVGEGNDDEPVETSLQEYSPVGRPSSNHIRIV